MTIDLYKQGEIHTIGPRRGVRLRRKITSAGGFTQFMVNKENTGNLADQTAPKTSPSELWSRASDDFSDTDLGPQSCIGQSILFVMAQKSGESAKRIIALSLEDGTTQYQSSQFGSSGGLNGNVLAYNDGVVYAGYENILRAFSADDLSQSWQSADLGDTILSSPTYFDGFIYVHAGDNVYKISESDGSQSWSFDIGGGPLDVIAVSVDETNSQIVAGEVFGSVKAIDIDVGTQNWSSIVSFSAGVTVADGGVFVGSGSDITRLDPSDGSEVWSEADTNGNDVRRGFAYDGEGVIYTDDGSSITKVDKDDGSVSWTTSLDDRGEGWPIYVDGSVYIMDRDLSASNIYGIDASDGSELFKQATTLVSGQCIMAANENLFLTGGFSGAEGTFGVAEAYG